MKLQIACLILVEIDLSDVHAGQGGAVSVRAAPHDVGVEVDDDDLPSTLREGHFPGTLRGLGFDMEDFDGH